MHAKGYAQSLGATLAASIWALGGPAPALAADSKPDKPGLIIEHKEIGNWLLFPVPERVARQLADGDEKAGKAQVHRYSPLQMQELAFSFVDACVPKFTTELPSNQEIADRLFCIDGWATVLANYHQSRATEQRISGLIEKGMTIGGVSGLLLGGASRGLVTSNVWSTIAIGPLVWAETFGTEPREQLQAGAGLAFRRLSQHYGLLHQQLTELKNPPDADGNPVVEASGQFNPDIYQPSKGWPIDLAQKCANLNADSGPILTADLVAAAKADATAAAAAKAAADKADSAAKDYTKAQADDVKARSGYEKAKATLAAAASSAKTAAQAGLKQATLASNKADAALRTASANYVSTKTEADAAQAAANPKSDALKQLQADIKAATDYCQAFADADSALAVFRLGVAQSLQQLPAAYLEDVQNLESVFKKVDRGFESSPSGALGNVLASPLLTIGSAIHSGSTTGGFSAPAVSFDLEKDGLPLKSPLVAGLVAPTKSFPISVLATDQELEANVAAVMPGPNGPRLEDAIQSIQVFSAHKQKTAALLNQLSSGLSRISTNYKLTFDFRASKTTADVVPSDSPAPTDPSKNQSSPTAGAKS